MDDTTATASTATSLLLDAFGRVHEQIPGLVEGAAVDDLLWRPDADANSIAWLVWHLTRVQDDHLAALSTALGRPCEQVWQEWRGRFALPYPDDAIGYGHSSDDVGAFRLDDPALLTGYHEAVYALTVDVVGQVSDDDLGRVVDDAWDPPVTAGARLVSVIGDTTAHVGQAQYVQGLIARR